MVIMTSPRCPEALFNPSVLNLEQTPLSLPQLAVESIQLTDPEIQLELLNNIVLSGAGTLFPGE